MPFKEIPDGASPSGGYPWRLDGNYDSKTYITNVSSVRAAFGAFIDPKGGSRYVIDTHYLEPGETVIIDFRKIRDQQIPNRSRQTLPKDVKFGAIQWFPLFYNGRQHFIGRTEVLDRSSAVAANFSCESCPCPPDAGYGYITPGSVFVLVGDSASVYTSVTQRDVCQFNQLPDYTFTPYSWSSPSFISWSIGSSPSILSALAPGSSSYFAPFFSDTYIYNPFAPQICTYQSTHGGRHRQRHGCVAYSISPIYEGSERRPL